MRIATWNINGVRARLEGAVNWLKDAQPDVLCFQEIKTEDESFPRDAFGDLGYNIALHGQKGFNGVAILSKMPFDEVSRGLPGDEDDAQARFLEAVFSAARERSASPRSICPTAIRRLRQVRLQARLHGAARAHAKALLAGEEPS